VNAREPGLDAAAFRQLITPRMALCTPTISIRRPQLTHPASNGPASIGLNGGQHVQHAHPGLRPLAGSAFASRQLLGPHIGEDHAQRNATLNRTMTIPVIRAARPGKPEAPRASAGRAGRSGAGDFTEHGAGDAGR
jgi:hypothetical protein